MKGLLHGWSFFGLFGRLAMGATILLAGVNPAGAQPATYAVVHAFPLAERHPGKLLLGNDGSTLYGTSIEGGLNGDGVLFRIGLNGSGYSVLHAFRRGDPNNGASPTTGTIAGRAALIQGANGMLFGTTQEGGPYNQGTVYEVNANGSGFELLYSFAGQTDGAIPLGGLLMGQDGMLYGTASAGGLYGDGTLFRIDPNLPASSFQVVHPFNRSDANNGAMPFAGLIQGSDGTVYGTTWIGGPGQNGIVFSMAPDGTAFKVLYGFAQTGQPDDDGPHPCSGLVLGSNGLLYGTTTPGGGMASTEYHTVFKLNPAGTGFGTVYTFNGNSDGTFAAGGLHQGADSALYGTTYAGGPNGYGTVFRLTTDGSFSVVHAFGPPWGADHGVVQASDGNLYGTAGSPDTLGTIFAVSPAGANFHLIHSFVITEGASPAGGMILGIDGALYGTTLEGGNTGAADFGAVFKMNLDGTGSSVLHSFDYATGASPIAALVQGSDGTLYGTTAEGGPGGPPFNGGTVFELKSDGTFQMLHGFTGPDGSLNLANSPLLLGADGSLYGASMAGSTSLGEIYRLTPDHGFAALYEFSYSGVQGYPGSIIWGPNNLLYGMTQYDQNFYAGSVFSLPANQSVQPTILHQFNPVTDGGQPRGPLVLGSDGALYGTTTLVGDLGTGNVQRTGTIFKLQQNGTGFLVLYTFTGGNDGAEPQTLMQGRDGVLYGTTYFGGANNLGVLFKIQPDGTGFAVLHSFDASTGAYPSGPLLQTVDGNLFGVAWSGGPKGGGVAYRLSGIACPGSPACSGHGTCGNGTCTCQTGYSGADCSVTCPGGPTCSGHGTCSNGTCACQAGYSGSSCSVTCPGGPTCSGHGTCSNGTCTCQAGYSGSDCSVTCPGSPACSGHGTCSSGTCTCQAGYSGSDCSVTCPGGPTCSGHGTCNNGTCACQIGYSGASCSVNCASNSTCPDGSACNNNSQCGSRVCTGNLCRPPGCAPHCNQGADCGANSDCGSQVCTNALCQAPACSPLCGPAAVCGNNSDCLSRVCTNNLCQPPSCSPHCNQGAACGASSDCGSRVCTAGLCQAPACYPNCASGSPCGNNSDCRSRTCNNYVCR